jgi:hypothetical protein
VNVKQHRADAIRLQSDGIESGLTRLGSDDFEAASGRIACASVMTYSSSSTTGIMRPSHSKSASWLKALAVIFPLVSRRHAR